LNERSAILASMLLTALCVGAAGNRIHHIWLAVPPAICSARLSRGEKVAIRAIAQSRYRVIGSTSDPRKPILSTMTKLLEQALQAVRLLPPDDQDEIAQIMIQLARSEESEPVRLSAEEREAIARSREAAMRGEFASDDQVEAVWAKHRR
jgi:hypothetical protein